MEYDDDAIRTNLRNTMLSSNYYKHIYIFDISYIRLMSIKNYNNGELIKLLQIPDYELEYVTKELLYLCIDICLDYEIFHSNLDYPLVLFEYLDSVGHSSFTITDYVIDTIRVYLSRFKNTLYGLMNNLIDMRYNIDSELNRDVTYYGNYFRVEDVDLEHDVNFLIVEKYFYQKLPYGGAT